MHQLDTKVQAKRVPLLATENNSPSKKKTSTTTIDPAAKAQRKEKLARLAANLRSMERADRGESPSPPPSTPPPAQQRKRTSNEGNGESATSSTASPRKKKNSKWAALAAERQGWDADFKGENIMETSTAIIVQKKEMKEQVSARDMVTAALARAGKQQPPPEPVQSAAQQLKKRTKPDGQAAASNDRVQELNNMERSERVANLIAGWGTPVNQQQAQPSTPKQDHLPAKVKETRLSGKTI